MAVTMPLAVITVPMPVLPLLQVPPVVASDNEAVVPVQSKVGPVMGDKGFTVTTAVAVHPAPTV
jgi:hypothetical protein